ncbi:MAG: hypothetical protein M0R51_17195, partial [Clostridia bacterium]|nr:hypothetical protein [Clostridia bacterium]
MGFTDTKALDIYYGADRKPRDINGEQITMVGEDGTGAHLATEIHFHFTDVGTLGDYSAVVAVAKRSDGQMRFDECERVGTGTDAYYVLELNNWYLSKWGTLLIDVKAYTNTTEPNPITIADGVLTIADGTK